MPSQKQPTIHDKAAEAALELYSHLSEEAAEQCRDYYDTLVGYFAQIKDAVFEMRGIVSTNVEMIDALKKTGEALRLSERRNMVLREKLEFWQNARQEQRDIVVELGKEIDRLRSENARLKDYA